jgi:hypothetical protein
MMYTSIDIEVSIYELERESRGVRLDTFLS